MRTLTKHHFGINLKYHSINIGWRNLKKSRRLAMNPEDFLKEIKEFFSLYYPKFVFVEPGGKILRYSFYKNFPGCGLSIVVLTPVVKKNEKHSLIPKNEIEIDLRTTKTKQIKIFLVGTMLYGNWKNVLEEKIRVLEDLIVEIRRCDDCGEIMPPRVCKRKDKGTWFVSFFCWHCRKWENTPLGICLKTRLHRFIQHKRT
jgi:hypothetical protein